MIAEPVRRAEDFETNSEKKKFCEKIERMLLMFNNMDQLYYDNHKLAINFPSRPVIVIICEDDNHIKEVSETVSSIIKGSNQEVWFSNDLRIFNYDKRGERLLCVNNNELQVVDIKKIFGKDKETDAIVQ